MGTGVKNEQSPKRFIIAFIVVLLFIYAYKTFKSKDGINGKTPLSAIRKITEKKKVQFKDCDKHADNEKVDKEKINELVKSIMLKQIPNN